MPADPSEREIEEVIQKARELCEQDGAPDWNWPAYCNDAHRALDLLREGKG